MKGDANHEYLTILNALGEHIAKNRSELVFANYEKEMLEKKLAEAEEEIAKLKGD